MGARRVMLIRHAEESSAHDADLNLDERGLPDEGGLSVRGWQRTGALVRYFAPLRGHSTDTGVDLPDIVIAMGKTADQQSRRPALTVEPLSRALGLALQLAHGPERLQRLLAMSRDTALVCWRHASLPSVATSLHPGARVPTHWPEDRYDLVWILDLPPAEPQFRQLAQQLLPGDSDDPGPID